MDHPEAQFGARDSRSSSPLPTTCWLEAEYRCTPPQLQNFKEKNMAKRNLLVAINSAGFGEVLQIKKIQET